MFGFSEASAENSNDYAITVLNESSMKLELLDKKASIKQNKDGSIEIKKGKYKESLPIQTLDSNGELVNLVYKVKGNDVLIELHSTKGPFQDSNLVESASKWKCAFGVLGGYYTGALAGLGAGAAAGSVIPVLGTAAGAIGMTIVGAAGGAMTGAAAACY